MDAVTGIQECLTSDTANVNKVSYILKHCKTVKT